MKKLLPGGMFLAGTLFVAQAAIGQTNMVTESWFADHDFDVKKELICPLYKNYYAYTAKTNMEMRSADKNNGDACGKIFSIEGPDGSDLFMYGIYIYRPVINTNSFDRYRDWFSKSFYTKEKAKDISFIKWRDLSNSMFSRELLLVKPNGDNDVDNRKKWGVNDIALRNIGDKTVVIFKIAPYIAWSDENLTYAKGADKDDLAKMRDISIVLDKWSEENMTVIGSEWK